MRIRIKIGVCLILLAFKLEAGVPDTLSIDFCLEEAIKNYPLIKQKDLLAESLRFKTEKLNTAYYPQLQANAQMTYQSDVTSIPALTPFMTPVTFDKDQYKFTLDVNQVIWDGGVTGIQKNIEMAGYDVDRNQLDAELYKIKERVNALYFSILMAQQQEQIVQNISDNLIEKMRSVSVASKNGMALQSDVDVLNAEIIRTEQQLIEAASARLSALIMLGEFLNAELTAGTTLLFPQMQTDNPVFEDKRKESEVFDYQLKRIDTQKLLVKHLLYPKLFVFGQLGYGKPGLNMLSNSFDDYYLAGAKVTWNISAFYNQKKDLKLFDLQKEIISSQKEVFEKNLKMACQKEAGEIIKLSQLIEKDDEIIALREKIRRTASSKLDKGTISATDYVNELYAEKQARLNKELHLIQQAMYKMNYLFQTGKL